MARAGHLRLATSSSWTEVGEGAAGWVRWPRGSRLGRQHSQRGTSGVQGTVGLQGRGCREQKGSLGPLLCRHGLCDGAVLSGGVRGAGG